MVAPFRHVGDFGELEDEEALEIHRLASQGIGALAQTFAPQGYNAGLEPRAGRRRGRGRPRPSPCRPALGRRHQLHAGSRGREGASGAPRGDTQQARRGVAAGLTTRTLFLQGPNRRTLGSKVVMAKPPLPRGQLMKKVISLLLIGLVASLAVVVVSPAGAKKGHPKGTAAAKRHAVGGVVQSVASDSVTLTRKKGDPVTIQVNGDTKIVVNGKSATLSDVKVGYVALAKVTKAGGPAKLLRSSRRSGPRHHRRRTGRLGRRQLDHAQEEGRQHGRRSASMPTRRSSSVARRQRSPTWRPAMWRTSAARPRTARPL